MKPLGFKVDMIFLSYGMEVAFPGLGENELIY